MASAGATELSREQLLEYVKKQKVKIKRLETELQELQEKGAAKAVQDDGKAAAAEMEQLRVELRTYEEQLSENASEMYRMSRKLAAAEESLSQQTELLEKNKELSFQVHSLTLLTNNAQEKHFLSDKIIAELKNSLAETEAFRENESNRATYAETKLSEMTAENERLRDETQASAETLSLLNGRIRDLEKLLTESEAKYNETERHLNETRTELSTMREAKNRDGDSSAQLAQDLTQTKEKLQRLMNEKSEVDSLLDLRTKERDAKSIELDESHRSYSSLEAKLNQLVLDRSNMESEYREIVNDRDKMLKQLQDLESKSSDSEVQGEEIEKLRCDLKTVNSEYEKLKSEFDERQLLVTALGDDLHAAHQSLHDLKSNHANEMDNLMAQISDKNAAINTLNTTVATLEQETHTSKQKIDDLLQSQENLMARLQSTESDLSSSQASASSHTEEISKLRADVGQLQRYEEIYKKTSDELSEAKSMIIRLEGEKIALLSKIDMAERQSAPISAVIDQTASSATSSDKSPAISSAIKSPQDAKKGKKGKKSGKALSEASATAAVSAETVSAADEQEDIRKELEKLSMELQSSREEITRLEHDLNQSLASEQQAKEKVSSMEQELNAKILSLSSATEDLSSLNAVHNEYVAKIQTMEERLQSLANDKDKLQEELSMLQDVNAKYDALVEKSSSGDDTLRTLRDQISSYEEKIANMTASIEEKDKEMRELTVELTRRQTALDEAFIASNNTSASLTETEQELERMKEQLAQLKAEKESLLSELAIQSKTIQDNLSHEDILRERLEEINHLKSDLSTAQAKSSEYHEQYEQLLAIHKEYHQSSGQEIEGYQKEMNDALSKISSLTEEKESLQSQLESLQKIVETLRGDYEALEQQKESVSSDQNRIELDSLQQEVSDCKHKLEEAKANIAKKQSLLQQLSSKLKDLQSQLDSAKESKQLLENRIHELELLNNQLNQSLNEAIDRSKLSQEKEILELKEEIKRYEESYDQLEQENHTNLSAIETLKSSLSNEKSIQMKIKAENETLRSDVTILMNKENEYRNQILSFEQSMRSKNEEIALLKTSIDQKSMELDSRLKQMIEKEQRHIEDIKQGYESQISSLQRQLEDANEEKAIIASAVQSASAADLQQQNNALLNQLEQLQQLLDTEREENVIKRREEVEALAEKLKRMKSLLARTKNALQEREGEVANLRNEVEKISSSMNHRPSQIEVLVYITSIETQSHDMDGMKSEPIKPSDEQEWVLITDKQKTLSPGSIDTTMRWIRHSELKQWIGDGITVSGKMPSPMDQIYQEMMTRLQIQYDTQILELKNQLEELNKTFSAYKTRAQTALKRIGTDDFKRQSEEQAFNAQIDALKSEINELKELLEYQEQKLEKQLQSINDLTDELYQSKSDYESLQRLQQEIMAEKDRLVQELEENDRKHALAIASLSSAVSQSYENSSVPPINGSTTEASDSMIDDFFPMINTATPSREVTYKLAHPDATNNASNRRAVDQAIIVSDVEDGDQSPMSPIVAATPVEVSIDHQNKHVSNKLILLHQVFYSIHQYEAPLDYLYG